MHLFFFLKINKDKKNEEKSEEKSGKNQAEEQHMLIRDIEIVSKRIIAYETKKSVEDFIEILKSIIRITETKPQILNVRTFFSTICKDMYVYTKDYIRLQDSYKIDEVDLQMTKLRALIEQINEISKDIYIKQLDAHEFNVDVALRQLENLKKYGL